VGGEGEFNRGPRQKEKVSKDRFLGKVSGFAALPSIQNLFPQCTLAGKRKVGFIQFFCEGFLVWNRSIRGRERTKMVDRERDSTRGSQKQTKTGK